MSWNEFWTYRMNLHIHGPMQQVNEPFERAQFHYLDTEANTVAADGFYSLQDFQYFVAKGDLDRKLQCC